jgi:hypothetical protein
MNAPLTRTLPRRMNLGPGRLLSVSVPQLRNGRWYVLAMLNIGGDRVLINASAPSKLVQRAAQRFGFGDDDVGCGCVGGFGDDETSGIFDDIVSVVGKVARNPLVQAAAAVIPYGSTVVAGVTAATSLYGAVRGGAPKAKKRLKKIKRDAKRGKPAAKKALAQLNTVARADHLRQSAKRGNVKALKGLRMIGQGLSRKDPAALEAATLYSQLDALEKAKEARARAATPRCPTQGPAYEPDGDDGELDAPEPIEVNYATDESTPYDVAEAIGAAISKRPLSPKHTRLAAALWELNRRAAQRSARRAAPRR